LFELFVYIVYIKTYKYFRAGNPTDLQRKTQGGFALMGGGKDLDRAFQWICERTGGPASIRCKYWQIVGLSQSVHALSGCLIQAELAGECACYAC